MSPLLYKRLSSDWLRRVVRSWLHACQNYPNVFLAICWQRWPLDRQMISPLRKHWFICGKQAYDRERHRDEDMSKSVKHIYSQCFKCFSSELPQRVNCSKQWPWNTGQSNLISPEWRTECHVDRKNYLIFNFYYSVHHYCSYSAECDKSHYCYWEFL